MRRRPIAALAATIALVAVLGSVWGWAASAAPSWSTVKSPNGAGPISQLSAVSCPSATFCMAVGHYYTPLPGLVRRTLAEKWNGKTWSVVASPSPFSTSAELRGVSCVSPTVCFAVGSFTNRRVESPIIERWDGARWSIVANAANTAGKSLSAVSCTNASSCLAVGSVSERWNGKSWTVLADAAGAPVGSNLRGVSCPSTTFCFAVGSGNRAARLGGAPATLTERWNGKVWTVVASPNGPHSDRSYLNGVSCPSATFCFAVGQSDFGTDPEGVPDSVKWLIERWDGKAWSVIAAPKPKNATVLTQLNGVSCPNAKTCFAAGYYYTDGNIPTVIERWNGSTWSIAYNPGYRANLYGVSCASVTGCFAVGANMARTIVQRFT